MKFMIDLPEELIQRALEVGLEITDTNTAITEAIEKEIARRKAADYLRKTAEALRALPDEEKPTLDEIDATIRQVRRGLNQELSE
jgi:post-segregation antitoxin (ccd killing protein)